MPQAATVEDCDSEGKPVSGTARQARRRASTKPPPKVVQRRDAPSDSGYSSHSSNAHEATRGGQTIVATTTLARQAVPPSPTQSRTVVQGSDSQRGRPAAPSRSASSSRHCTSADCRDAACLSQRNKERRYTLPQQMTREQYDAFMAAQAQQAQQAHQQQHAAQQQPPPRQYQYPPQYPPPPATQAVPIVNPQPRPGAAPTPRGRPASVYGYANVSGWSQPQAHGPPPSPSAYSQNYFPAPYQTQYSQPPPNYSPYGSTPPNQIIPAYPQASPIVQTSPAYPVAPGLSRTYSARQVDPAVPGYTTNTVAPAQPGLARALSARQTTRGTMPGAFPMQESSEEESESEESDYDSEEERRERREEARRRQRDSKMMPPPAPPSRRPSLKARNTTQAISTSREPVHRAPLHRAPVSDTGVDYYSSDYPSDRTARAVVDRRSSHSSRSRRPSVSTTASSGRTKATTVSSGSGSGTRKYIIEDRHGRRKEYLSRDQYDELVRRTEMMKLEEQDARDRAEAYQRQVRGPQTPELTAENIQKSQRRASGSHMSQSNHSRKSSSHSHSSSKPSAKTDGIRIQSAGTVLHVYGDATVEMRPGEDGSHFIKVGSGGGGSSRDSAYHGSKSSGSRISRRKDTITEEYEAAL